MRSTLKFIMALAVSLVAMMAFRALVATIYTVEGNGLAPVFLAGDRVLVNRWSYGLRVGCTNGLFNYGRIWRRPIERGDIVAFENPQNTNEVLICRCTALPGDTVSHQGETLVVPGRVNCAKDDFYWMEAVSRQNTTDSHLLGFIAEELIIGRVILVLFSHNPAAPVWKGWRQHRMLMPL